MTTAEKEKSMSDSQWQVGDLALCIGVDDDDPRCEESNVLTTGQTYRVARVITWYDDTGLVISGAYSDHPTGAWYSGCFRKIKPDNEACEPEFAAMLQSNFPVSI